MNIIVFIDGQTDRLHVWMVYTIVALAASPITLVIIMLYASIHVCVCVGGVISYPRTIYNSDVIYKPRHEKTCFAYMRKQRQRSHAR